MNLGAAPVTWGATLGATSGSGVGRGVEVGRAGPSLGPSRAECNLIRADFIRTVMITERLKDQRTPYPLHPTPQPPIAAPTTSFPIKSPPVVPPIGPPGGYSLYVRLGTKHKSTTNIGLVLPTFIRLIVLKAKRNSVKYIAISFLV